MYELRRIYKNNITFFVILGLIILQIVLYFYQETELESVSEIREYSKNFQKVLREGEYKDMTLEELEEGVEYDEFGNAYNLPENYREISSILWQKEYHQEYEQYVDTIKDNALQMINNVKEDSFEEKNIEKTVEDYEDAENIELKEGMNNNVISFVGFKITDYLILIFLVFIVVKFFEDRKKGLSGMVRAAQKGRFSLTACRIAALLISTIFITILMYGVLYLLVTYMYIGNNDRPIQSVEIFKECDRVISIWQFFGEYVFIKCFVLFLIAIIIYLVMSLFKNIGAVLIILFLFFSSQYVMYESISYTESYNYLKFINIFSFLDVENLYTTYYNINIFGQPVGIRQLLAAAVIMALWIIFIIAAVNSLMYGTVEIKALDSIYNRFLKLKGRLCTRQYVIVWELRKIVFLNKGIIILAAFILCAYGMVSRADIRAVGGMSAAKSVYYNENGNKVTKDILSDIQEAKDKYEKLSSEFMNAGEKIQKGEITEDEYFDLELEYENAYGKYKIFTDIEEDVKYVQSIKKGKDIDAMLISQDSYEYLFGKDNYEGGLRKCLIIIVAGVLLLHNTFSVENQTGFILLIRSAGKGKKKSFNGRIISGVSLFLVMGLIMFIIETYNIWHIYGFDRLDAPVQSLKMFSEFPLNISIQAFILMWYILRLTVIAAIAMAVMCISMYSGNMFVSMWTAIGIIVLPSVLTYIGIPGMSYISVIVPMWIMNIWIGKGTDSILSYVPIIILWIIGIVSYFALKKKYEVR